MHCRTVQPSLFSLHGQDPALPPGVYKRATKAAEVMTYVFAAAAAAEPSLLYIQPLLLLLLIVMVSLILQSLPLLLLPQ
jgi:hypothetical protein